MRRATAGGGEGGARSPRDHAVRIRIVGTRPRDPSNEYQSPRGLRGSDGRARIPRGRLRPGSIPPNCFTTASPTPDAAPVTIAHFPTSVTCMAGKGAARRVIRQHSATACPRRLGGVSSCARNGRVPKRTKGTDCKSVIRRFESGLGLFSSPLHFFLGSRKDHPGGTETQRRLGRLVARSGFSVSRASRPCWRFAKC